MASERFFGRSDLGPSLEWRDLPVIGRRQRRRPVIGYWLAGGAGFALGLLVAALAR